MDGQRTGLNSQPYSLLMQQPVDIVNLISEHLQDCDVVSLALTCKALYALLQHKVKYLHDRKRKVDLILPLEPDLARRYQYCPYCICLHKFRFVPDKSQPGFQKLEVLRRPLGPSA
ncbi:hypothetical protein QBC47DRAFT_133118 [Echria macrotheca]|uniref:F-box domain-containing protein n=1 Tax=Echria macrotheca TaxID=438768 RepID=A0AAJ0FC89_9PEZI|nr:hypothetical protein QBC47DRAFT_133118 [Echria macrotheca]